MIFSFHNASFRDAETGLYNQAYFMEVFNREWHRLIRDKSSLSVLLLNPHIKANGTLASTKLLQVANILESKTLRSTDIICRFNKYCFAMGLFGLDSAGTKVIVERIQEELFEQEKLGVLHINLSIGAVHVKPNSQIELGSVFERTITALHCAEANGANNFQLETYTKH